MESQQRTILVPWDFTIVAEYAFAYAVKLSKIIGTSITIIHIVSNEKQIEAATQKLENDKTNLKGKYDVEPSILVIKGNIFKDISKFASEANNVELVIMGTHGIKGMQKLTGSRALKVILGSKVPFFVVQDFPTEQKFDSIIFPVDFKKENKEKIKWAYYLCSLYHSKIYLVHAPVSDKLFKGRVFSNIDFARKYFRNTSFEYEIVTLEKKVNFAQDVVTFAQEKNAGAILIMTSKSITFIDYVIGPTEQAIIANSAKIPVMVVNPRKKKMDGGFSATGN